VLQRARETALTTIIGGVSVAQLMKRPDFGPHSLPPDLRAIAEPPIWELIEAELKYEGYAVRQSEHNKAVARRADQRIPAALDFAEISGLRSETRQKLAVVRPSTLGQAARISGITPADVSIIHVWLKKYALVTDNK
jgi:tRNA uridine 5-carboxymethylaminomethyl modification enzyme